MAVRRRTQFVEDVGGSFARFIREAPKVARVELAAAVQLSAFALSRRMITLAPGPSDDPPHIMHDIEATSRGLSGRAGILDDEEQAHVALYNEYRPNQQPFMRPAAEDMEGEFKANVTRALKQVERSLSGGGGGLL